MARCSGSATSRLAEIGIDGLDQDSLLAAVCFCRPSDRSKEFAGDRARDLEACFVRCEPDRADFVSGDVAAPAEERQNPARVDMLPPADVHAKPDRILEAWAVPFLLSGPPRLG